MKMILVALLMLGAAGSVRAQTDAELDRIMNEFMGKEIDKLADEIMSCMPFESAVMVSERGAAVAAYLAAKNLPKSPTKSARIQAALDKALRLGGMVRVPATGAVECRLEYGRDRDYVYRPK